ncbi:protein trichome birefringence-like 2 isoform X3 [Carex rostrata]
MDWRKKLSAFSERSLASGFTLGVVVSLLLILLLSVTSSSYSSLFPWFSTLSFQNNSPSPVVLEPDRGSYQSPGQKDANFSVVQPGNLHSNNSLANHLSNATSTIEKLPLDRIGGGNLSSSNTTSNGSSLSFSSIEEPQFGKLNGGNWSSIEKNSKNWGHEGGNGSLHVEKLPFWNSTINNTHQGFTPSLYNTTSVSSNTTTELNPSTENSTLPNNSGKEFLNANSTKENTSLEKPSGSNVSLDKERTFVQKDQEKNLSSSYNNTEIKEDGSLQNLHCDIFDGKWVRDETDPFYPPGSCPYIDDDFNCFKNGRPDNDFLKWRWQPNQCNIPRLNATDFLERLRGKRLLFVGDSLNRNMWESLVCILRHAVQDKTRVFEASGKKRFKTSGYYSFRFKDYKCYVDFVRSTFLVKEVVSQKSDGVEDEKLRLDILDDAAVAYRKADVIVFNTGHWWTHEKTSEGINYYQEGDHVYAKLKVLKAYEKALMTWARWIDANTNPKKTQVVFRGYSLTHFRGGQWNSGGQCHKETEPIFNDLFRSHYSSKNRAVEQVLRQMKTPVIYLNISRLTDYRKDAHPSIYRKSYSSLEGRITAEKSQDCSHWCLPGVPDSWNELLYVSLLIAGKGSWRN